jgi:hypothetical protein
LFSNKNFSEADNTKVYKRYHIARLQANNLKKRKLADKIQNAHFCCQNELKSLFFWRPGIYKYSIDFKPLDIKRNKNVWTKEFVQKRWLEMEQKVFPPTLLQQTETEIVKSWKQRGYINPPDDKLSISDLLRAWKIKGWIESIDE